MRLLLRVAALVAVILATVAYIARNAVDLPPGAGVVDAYDLSSPVSFALAPDEREIKIVTWLVTPGSGPTDPRSSRPYAVKAEELDDAGTLVRSERVWSVTRMERWEGPDGALLRAAWLPGVEAHVHASRVIRLHPRDAARGGVLRLSTDAAPPNARILATVYSRGARSLAAQVRLRHGDASEFRGDVAAAVAADGWDALPSAWQARAAELRWDRLGALSSGGGLVPTTRLAGTPVDGVEAVGILLPAGGAAAWTLLGPVTFGGVWAAPDGTPAPARGLARIVHADGRTEEHALDGPTFGPWTIPAAASVQVALDGSARTRWVRAWIEGGGSVWGAPAQREADGRTWIAPDLRAEQVYRAVPGGPLVVDAAGGEVLRVGLRPRLDPGALPGLDAAPGLTGPTVTLQAVDAMGAPVGAWTVETIATASAFERYVQGDDASSARVSEETLTFVRVPDGAARLVLLPSAPVDVSVEAATGVTPLPHPAYPPPMEGMTARFAPHLQEAWRARTPVGHEQLALVGRVIRIDGQVRLVPRTEEEEASLTRSLPIPGAFDLVAEPREPDATRNRALVDAAGSVVVVPPSGRLRLDYRVDPEQVGQAATITVAGQSLAKPLLATGGQLRLEGLRPGPASVSVATPGLFLARSTGALPWQTWRVRRLDPRGRLELTLPLGTTEVVVTPYLRGDGEVRLGWRLAPGLPPRPGVFDRATVRAGTAVLTPDGPVARPLSFADAALRRGAEVRIRLGDDLEADTRLALTLDGASPVWIRARSTRSAPSGSGEAR